MSGPLGFFVPSRKPPARAGSRGRGAGRQSYLAASVTNGEVVAVPL